MKSRINPRTIIPPKLIGYCITDEKKDALMSAALENNTDISFIGTEYAGESVGFIAGISSVRTFSEKPEEPPKCEVLIMSGLKNTVIDRLLKTLRQKNIVIELKCTVTPVNQRWELYKLIDELKREHKAMNENQS